MVRFIVFRIYSNLIYRVFSIRIPVATIFIFLFAPPHTLTLLLNFNIRRTANLSGSAKTSESRGNNNILMDGIREPHPSPHPWFGFT
jgi:hypothetical protein